MLNRACYSSFFSSISICCTGLSLMQVVLMIVGCTWPESWGSDGWCGANFTCSWGSAITSYFHGQWWRTSFPFLTNMILSGKMILWKCFHFWVLGFGCFRENEQCIILGLLSFFYPCCQTEYETVVSRDPRHEILKSSDFPPISGARSNCFIPIAEIPGQHREQEGHASVKGPRSARGQVLGPACLHRLDSGPNRLRDSQDRLLLAAKHGTSECPVPSPPWNCGHCNWPRGLVEAVRGSLIGR